MADVREFYDEFAGSVLLRDFQRPNERQDAIKGLCDRFIPPGARILEIGCGVGIITEHLSRRAAHVYGVDISGNNIRIARAYVKAANVELAVLDVVEQADELTRHGPFDAVLLADVIEHIPRPSHSALFASIGQVLVDDGVVVLTYPTPEYQEFLKAKEPQGLQVIDETVELRDLLQTTPLRPIFFSYKTVWHDNQYVHLVLARRPLFTRAPARQSPAQKVAFRVRKYLWRARNSSFVRRVQAELFQSGGGS